MFLLIGKYHDMFTSDHLSILPKFDNPEQHSEPCGLEEGMDRVWEEMRVAYEVRIRRQF